jgi:carnitine 3-dehydrogenase
MMRALKAKDWGAGNLLNRVDVELEKISAKPSEPLTQCNDVLTINRVIPTSWLDFNGHMNDSHYAEVFSKASDIILKRLGADADYIARGYSYFTVDLKIGYLNECHAGDEISVYTTIKLAEGKKLDLYHEMKDTSGNTVATGAQFLLHVDLTSRKSCMPEQPVASALRNLERKK